VIYDYYLKSELASSITEPELETFISSSLSASDQVQMENTSICELVQRGLDSSAYDVWRYAPRVEMADHGFHKRLAIQYRETV
jgi:choline monooxygenase